MMKKIVKITALLAALVASAALASCGGDSGSIYPIPAPTPTPQPSGYSIEISYIGDSSGQNHGTVAASKTKGIAQGEKIYLTITPDTGWQLDKLYCQYYDGGDILKNIDVTDNSFVMPNKNVYIGASFKETTIIQCFGFGNAKRKDSVFRKRLRPAGYMQGRKRNDGHNFCFAK